MIKKMSIVCGLIASIFLVPEDITDRTPIVPPTREEAAVLAEATVYMIDLVLEQSQHRDYSLDVEGLNHEYVECFDSEYLSRFLTKHASEIFMTEIITNDEIQLHEYERNKLAHRTLSQDELELLEEYKEYTDEYHAILDYNDEVFAKIVERDGGTVEGLKGMRLSTPTSYDRAVLGDEEYGSLFESTYVEMSQELQNFRNKYQDEYPFNYEVNVPWEYPFKTTQYDASMYGIYYPEVTGEFHINYSDYDNIEDKLPNTDNLMSYRVYNDCIEVLFDAREVGVYTMSALVDIDEGKITDISTYIPMRYY